MDKDEFRERVGRIFEKVADDLAEYVRWCDMDVWDWVAFYQALDERIDEDFAKEE